MKIRRASTGGGFTVIRNKTVRNVKVSWKSRAVLAWMLSHDDDYEFDFEDVVAGSECDGRHAARTALQELEKHGYLIRTRVRHADGTLGGAEWEVRDEPLPASDAVMADAEADATPQVAPESENLTVDAEGARYDPVGPKSDFPTVDDPTVDNRTVGPSYRRPHSLPTGESGRGCAGARVPDAPHHVKAGQDENPGRPAVLTVLSTALVTEYAQACKGPTARHFRSGLMTRVDELLEDGFTEDQVREALRRLSRHHHPSPGLLPSLAQEVANAPQRLAQPVRRVSSVENGDAVMADYWASLHAAGVDVGGHGPREMRDVTHGAIITEESA